MRKIVEKILDKAEFMVTPGEYETGDYMEELKELKKALLNELDANDSVCNTYLWERIKDICEFMEMYCM